MKNRLIVRCQGGLGNQILQYFFYEYLSCCFEGVTFDVTWFKKHRVHQGYELEKIFKVKPRYAGGCDRAAVLGLHLIPLEHPQKWLPAGHGRHYIRVNATEKLTREELRERAGGAGNALRAYIEGYYVNGWYLRSLKQLKPFRVTFPEITDPRNLALIPKLKSQRAVTIHVRLGDYQGNAERDICGRHYYREAMDRMRELVTDPVFYVFSDGDTRELLSFGENEHTTIDWNKGESAFRDMQLMALCPNMIIANSTFSFCAALLNENPEPKVIEPKYYKPGDSWEPEPGWIQVDNSEDFQIGK